MDKIEPMDAQELVHHIVTNWTSLTGKPESAMHEEGHFPNVVYDLVEEHAIDMDEFQETWNEYFG